MSHADELTGVITREFFAEHLETREMNRLISIATLFLCTSIAPQLALADGNNGKVIGAWDAKGSDVGLANMDDIMDEPYDNCSQITGQVTVKGVQFSPSGRTLESFWFIAKTVRDGMFRRTSTE